MQTYSLANRSVMAIAAALMAAAPIPGTAATPPTVGELSAAWWQWALSLPKASNPLNDPNEDGRLCGVGQHGRVWFFGGSFDGAVVNRQCKVPAGTPILVPVINGECSVIETSPSDPLPSKRELRACATEQMDLVTKAIACVDGRKVAVVRAQSPLFSFTLPPGDVLGIIGNSDRRQAPNPSPAVADGYWALLPPLPNGTHTVTGEGKLVAPGFAFTQLIKYTVEIVAPRAGAAAALSQAVIPSGVIPSAAPATSVNCPRIP